MPGRPWRSRRRRRRRGRVDWLQSSRSPGFGSAPADDSLGWWPMRVVGVFGRERSDDRDRTVSPVQHAAADGTEQQAAEAATSAASHDDELGALGGVNEHVGGSTLHQMGLHLDLRELLVHGAIASAVICSVRSRARATVPPARSSRPRWCRRWRSKRAGRSHRGPVRTPGRTIPGGLGRESEPSRRRRRGRGASPEDGLPHHDDRAGGARRELHRRRPSSASVTALTPREPTRPCRRAGTPQ